MQDTLAVSARGFGLRIHAFVLMSNHFHLLVTTPNANISEFMQWFMGQTSREITRLSGRINQTYGARHHKTSVTSAHSFMNCYKYVYQNPIRAGVCSRVEDYPYSTLAGLCGLRPLFIPLAEDTILFEDFEGTLKWLNERVDDEQNLEMKRALKKKIFRYPVQRTGYKSILETKLL